MRQLSGLVALAFLLVPLTGHGQGRVGAEAESQQRLQRGNELLAEGKLDEAEQLYREALRFDPRLVEAYERYSMLLIATRRFKDGEKLLRQEGLRLLPNNAALKVQLGMHLLELGRTKEAHAHLAPAVETHKERVEIQAYAARCCLRVEDHRCAAAALRNYLAHRPAELSARDVAFRVQLAGAELRMGNDEQAGKELEKALRAEPSHVQGRFLMAEVLLRRGECSSAMTHLEKLAGQVAAKEYNLHLGRAYLCVRRFKQALAQAEIYLKAAPGSKDGLLLKGDASLGLGRHKEALAAFERASSVTRGAPEVRLRLSRTYFATKQHARALSELAAELRKPDPGEEILTLAVRAAVGAKDAEQATELAGRLERSAPRSAGALHIVGRTHVALRRLDEAVAIFERALELSPKHHGATRDLVRALVSLAQADFAKKQHPEALKKLRRAFELDSRSLVVNRNLALLYLEAGQPELALPRLQEVLAKVPQDYVANRLAGRALATLERHKEATARFDTAIGAVYRHGGLALARAYGEAAVSRVATGMIERSVKELEAALGEAQRDSSDQDLVVDLRRNLARVHVLRAQGSLFGEKEKVEERSIWQSLERALVECEALPPGEKLVVQAAVTIGALAMGRVAESKEMMKKLRGRLGSVMLPPYDKIGDRLLEAYGDYVSPGAPDKLRAAAQLERLARQLPPTVQSQLSQLAASAYDQAAVLLYRQGRTQPALAAFNKASRQGKESAQLRHNLAVVGFATGKKEQALATLEALKERLPLALCNIAVYYDAAGEPRRAYDLYRQCERRGAPFPGLREIIAAKRRVFGEGAP